MNGNLCQDLLNQLYLTQRFQLNLLCCLNHDYCSFQHFQHHLYMKCSNCSFQGRNCLTLQTPVFYGFDSQSQYSTTQTEKSAIFMNFSFPNQPLNWQSYCVRFLMKVVGHSFQFYKFQIPDSQSLLAITQSQRCCQSKDHSY